MQKTFKRCCGGIRGDISELLPFIYLFHRGSMGRQGNFPNKKRLEGIFAVNEVRNHGCYYKHGVILPLATCKDENIRATLARLKETLTFDLDCNNAGARRNQADQLLSPVFGNRVRLAKDAAMDGYVEFARDSSFFQILAENFQYLTEIMDSPTEGGHAVPTAFQPFPHTTYGSYLEWFYQQTGDGGWGWSHCVPSLVFDSACEVYEYFEHKRDLIRPPSILERHFRIAPKVKDQRVSTQFLMDCWGDIQLLLTVGDTKVKINLSNAFPPLESLIEWLKAIDREDAPVQFEIDEEGTEKTLSAYPTATEDRILFRVTDRYADKDESPFIDDIVDRRQLIAAFKSELVRFFQHNFDPEAWHGREFAPGDWHLGVHVLEDPWFRF